MSSSFVDQVDDGDERLLDRIVRDVREQSGASLPEELLRQYAREALAEVQRARIPNFVQLPATKQVLERVRANTSDNT